MESNKVIKKSKSHYHWIELKRSFAWSDNWYVFSFGAFIGFVLGVISHLGR